MSKFVLLALVPASPGSHLGQWRARGFGLWVLLPKRIRETLPMKVGTAFLWKGWLRFREGQAQSPQVSARVFMQDQVSVACGSVPPGSLLVPGAVCQWRLSPGPWQPAIRPGFIQPGAVRSRF